MIKGNSNHTHYRGKYVLALFFIGALVAISYTHIYLTLKKQHHFTTIIEAATNMCVLEKNISLHTKAMLLTTHYDTNQTLKNNLQASISKFEDNYRLLTINSKRIKPKIQSAVYNYNETSYIDNSISSFLSFVQNTVDSAEKLPAAPVISKLEQLHQSAASVVDDKVQLLTQMSTDNMYNMAVLIVVYFSLTVVGILATVYFLFYPMEKEIMQSEQSLQDRIKKLFSEKEYAKDSLARYKTIIDVAPTSIVVLDAKRDGVIIDANKKTTELFKMSKAKILQQTPVSISPATQANGLDTKQAATAYMQHVINGQELTIEWWCQDSQNNSFPCEAHLARLPSKEGEYIQVHFVDISERKQMEQKLLDINNQLEVANTARERFLAVMSHELRTPLNSIMGFAELLRDHVIGKLNSKQTEYANEIYHNGDHLLAIINDILDISKIDAGSFNLKLQPTNIMSLLEETVARIKGFPNALHKKFILQPNHKVKPVNVDPNRIRQVMINLLANAIKFTGEAGEITIWLKEHNDKLQIYIKDNGIGMNNQEIENVFEPFKQADGSLTREHVGTGLGLAIVKKIIDMHKGSVTVQSQINCGTTFKIQLPMVDL